MPISPNKELKLQATGEGTWPTYVATCHGEKRARAMRHAACGPWGLCRVPLVIPKVVLFSLVRVMDSSFVFLYLALAEIPDTRLLYNGICMFVDGTGTGRIIDPYLMPARNRKTPHATQSHTRFKRTSLNTGPRPKATRL